MLWHEIYQQIVDAVSAKTEKQGIILCKNFNDTHSELLENFYIYMQNNIETRHNHIVFFLINEHLSFLPDNIISCCKVVPFPRPTASVYKKGTSCKKMPPLHEITNIKVLHTPELPMNNHGQILDKLIAYMLDIRKLDLMILREKLYDMLVYNIDIHEATWVIFNHMISNDHIKEDDVADALIRTYEFFKYYNNNYRPIYHLERYILTLVKIIHKDKLVVAKT